jgi:hypothetical protein
MNVRHRTVQATVLSTKERCRWNQTHYSKREKRKPRHQTSERIEASKDKLYRHQEEMRSYGLERPLPELYESVDTDFSDFYLLKKTTTQQN